MLLRLFGCVVIIFFSPGHSCYLSKGRFFLQVLCRSVMIDDDDDDWWWWWWMMMMMMIDDDDDDEYDDDDDIDDWWLMMMMMMIWYGMHGVWTWNWDLHVSIVPRLMPEFCKTYHADSRRILFELHVSHVERKVLWNMKGYECFLFTAVAYIIRLIWYYDDIFVNTRIIYQHYSG